MHDFLSTVCHSRAVDLEGEDGSGNEVLPGNFAQWVARCKATQEWEVCTLGIGYVGCFFLTYFLS